MSKRKVRQRVKHLYKYRTDHIQVIQICVYDLDKQKIYIRTINEKQKSYTMSKLGKKQPMPDKGGWRSTCTILKDHAKEMKGDPESLTTSFIQKLIGVKCK